MTFRPFAVFGPSLLTLALVFSGCASEFSDTRVVCPEATVNERPALFFMDTGTSVTVLTERGAQRLGVKLDPVQPEKDTTDGGIPGKFSERAQVSVGAVAFASRLFVVDFPMHVDGLVGWPEIKDNILVFDADRREVRRVEALPPETAGWLKWKIHPGAVLLLEVPLPEGSTGTLLVDTGSGEGLTLPPQAWQDWRSVHRSAHSMRIEMFLLVTGFVPTVRAWADGYKLGPLALSDLPLTEGSAKEFADVTEMPDPVGTLGLYGLTRVDLVVDGKAGYAYLHARPPPGPSFPPLKRAGGAEGAAQGRAANGNWTVADNVRLNFDRTLEASAYVNGMADMHKGDFKGAIAEFTRVLELDPTNDTALSNRGGAKCESGDLDGAIADCDRALEIDPKNTGALSNRAAAKVGKKDWAGALADFDRAVALQPNDAVLLSNRGAIKILQGDDLAGGIADLNRALEIDPKSSHAYSNRGAAKVKQGDWDGAIADDDHALALDPNNFQAYLNRGRARMHKSEWTEAIADFTRTLELDASGAAAYYSERGRARNAQGDYAAAIADYAKSIALEPNDSDYEQLYRQALQLRLGQATPEFVPTITLWKDRWPKTIGQFLSGQLDEAALLAAAENPGAEPVDGQKCEAFYFIGMTRLRQGDPVGAREYFQKSVATGVKDYNEYLLSGAELARLEARRSQP